MPSFVTSIPFLAVTGVIILVLLIAFVASRYKVAGANEALIIAGSRGAKVRNERGQAMAISGDKGVKVVVGGGTFVRPLLDRVGKLKLTARQINVQLGDAVTSQGIKVQVQGVATFKIGRDVESLRNAAERFLDAKPEQVDSIVKNVLEGSLRSIVGTLTIEELIRDRQKLLQQVQDAAKRPRATWPRAACRSTRSPSRASRTSRTTSASWGSRTWPPSSATRAWRVRLRTRPPPCERRKPSR